jgi:hypothetical protein
VAAIIFASVSFSTPSSSLAWHFHALFRPWETKAQENPSFFFFKKKKRKTKQKRLHPPSKTSSSRRPEWKLARTGKRGTREDREKSWQKKKRKKKKKRSKTTSVPPRQAWKAVKWSQVKLESIKQALLP